MNNNINGIVVKVKDDLHLFRLNRNKQMKPYSIPMGEAEENAYTVMQDNEVLFVNAFAGIRFDNPVSWKFFKKYPGLKIYTRVLGKMSVLHDSEGESTTIAEVLEEGGLQEAIDHYFEEISKE